MSRSSNGIHRTVFLPLRPFRMQNFYHCFPFFFPPSPLLSNVLSVTTFRFLLFKYPQHGEKSVEVDLFYKYECVRRTRERERESSRWLLTKFSRCSLLHFRFSHNFSGTLSLMLMISLRSPLHHHSCKMLLYE